MACHLCGCEGWHACTGAPIPPWTEEEKERLNQAIGEMLEWKENVVNIIEVPAEVLPVLATNQVWCCSEGCGECAPIQVEFEYGSTERPIGTLIERKVGQVWVSACCKADLELWDEGRQNFVSFTMGGGKERQC
jgi:hypothetical protein